MKQRFNQYGSIMFLHVFNQERSQYFAKRKVKLFWKHQIRGVATLKIFAAPDFQLIAFEG